MLQETLALAKEYQADHLSTKCEDYMGIQLDLRGAMEILTTDSILYYLTACERYHLATHRDRLVEHAANRTTKELQHSQFFGSVPATALKDVFLARSQTLENRIAQIKREPSAYAPIDRSASANKGGFSFGQQK
ncbi:hypothetical protein ACOMHN_016647 [Nucella lapillus]